MAEGLIILRARSRQLILTHGERAASGEGGPFQFVSGLIFRVIALQGKWQRRPRSVVRRDFELYFINVFRLGTELQGLSIGLLVVIPEIRQVELAERQY